MQILPARGPGAERDASSGSSAPPPRPAQAALRGPHCPPTSVHSCRLRPSSCRLSREARLGGHLEKALCMLEAPSRRRHWRQ